jgi:hypothetical protein
MDTETLRQLFRAEADKLKLELQQDNSRWHEVMRRENQEMQQTIYSQHRNKMVTMMQQVNVKIDDHCSTVNNEETLAYSDAELQTLNRLFPITSKKCLAERTSKTAQGGSDIMPN